jgi:hypothetical protein
MGLQKPAGLLAIHTNMPATVPADVDKAFKQVDYARLMGSRPQILYGISDSPTGLAAWLLDHNHADAQPAATVTAGLLWTSSTTGELTRAEILESITLYWLTNMGVSIPVAVSVFPGEQYEAPRSWTEKVYPNLIHDNKLTKGGHFAAWEEPLLLADELRASFKSLR